MIKKYSVKPQLNIFRERLEPCSFKPLTGFFRDGCCNTNSSDFGSHTVCAEITAEFLVYSKNKGNDLSTRNLALKDLSQEIAGVYVRQDGYKQNKMVVRR